MENKSDARTAVKPLTQSITNPATGSLATTSSTNTKTKNDVGSLEVPSFVRLFVIKRIIDEYLNNFDNSNRNDNCDENNSKREKAIRELVSVLKPKQVETTACTILFNLTTQSLKKYMKLFYNEDKQGHIIEIIFKQIIMIKFGEKSQSILTNGNESNYNYIKSLLFSSRDLMVLIFGYLTYYQRLSNGDLYNCSLVNSDWFFHSWDKRLLSNVNFKCNLTNYIIKTTNYDSPVSQTSQTTQIAERSDTGNSSAVIRSWQRLIHCKNVEIDLYDVYGPLKLTANSLLESKLSKMCNIESIKAVWDPKQEYRDLIKKLVNNNKIKIKYCNLRQDKQISYIDTIESLTLKNANCIIQNNIWIKWSRKCEKLIINRKVDRSWCNFVVIECDCSGIKYLGITNIAPRGYYDGEIPDEFFDVFGQNLKYFSVRLSNILDPNNVDQRVFKLWKNLKPIILKNKCNVELFVELLTQRDMTNLNNKLESLDFNHKIDKLYCHFEFGSKTFECVKKLMMMSYFNLKWLKIETFAHYLSPLKAISSFMQENISTFVSLKVIEIKDKTFYHLQDIEILNEILKLKIFIKRKIFLILNLNFYVDVSCMNSQHLNQFIDLFKKLCQNTAVLVSKQVPICINIQFSG